MLNDDHNSFETCANTNRAFEAIVHSQSHAHQIRSGILTCVSSIAWKAGFNRDRRVLIDANAMRTLTPPITHHDHTPDVGAWGQELSEHIAHVLTSAAQRAKTARHDAFATFTVHLTDETPHHFIVTVETFGSPEAVIVISSADADPDTPITPL